MLILTKRLQVQFKKARKGIISFTCLLFLFSCQENSISAQNENNFVIGDSNYVATEIILKTDVAKICCSVFEQQDTIQLSFCHGVASAQQIVKEQLQFIDPNVFFNVIENLHNKGNKANTQQFYSERIRAIASTNNNKLEGLLGEEKRQMDNYLSSLYYLLFVKNDAFMTFDLVAYRAGLQASWGKRKILGIESKMDNYNNYLLNFKSNVGKEFLKQNKSQQGVIETKSGLQYKLIGVNSSILNAELKSNENPDSNSDVTVHYQGILLTGSIFDSSYPKKEPITFGLNDVIKGWKEGIQLMKAGDKFRFYIPSELAYGEKEVGLISPNSVLVFEVELLSFN